LFDFQAPCGSVDASYTLNGFCYKATEKHNDIQIGKIQQQDLAALWPPTARATRIGENSDNRTTVWVQTMMHGGQS